jgi:hypothetical protein
VDSGQGLLVHPGHTKHRHSMPWVTRQMLSTPYSIPALYQNWRGRKMDLAEFTRC